MRENTAGPSRRQGEGGNLTIKIITGAAFTGDKGSRWAALTRANARPRGSKERIKDCKKMLYEQLELLEIELFFRWPRRMFARGGYAVSAARRGRRVHDDGAFWTKAKGVSDGVASHSDGKSSSMFP